VIGFSQHLIDVGDAQLDVYQGGDGSIVVCGSQPHSPRPESVERYAEHAQVVYVMPRGHGRSSPVRERADMQLDTIVADLEAVRRQLGIDRWVLEGYSGGSQLALTYALRYPNALAGLIVGFSVANIAGVLGDPRTVISPAHPTHQADLEMAGLDRHSAIGSEEPRWVQPRPDLWVLVQGNRPLIVSPAADPKPHLKVHLEEIVHFDVSPRLHEIRVPTLVVCGRKDPLVPVDMAVAMQQAIPDAELLVLEHTGHGWDTADEADVAVFRRTATRFLTRLESADLTSRASDERPSG
jgi:proline iminopeptidase